MTRQLRVLGAGHDPRTPHLVFLSLHNPTTPGGTSKYWLDRDEALTLIRTLAAALQRADQQHEPGAAS